MQWQTSNTLIHVINLGKEIEDFVHGMVLQTWMWSILYI